MHWWLNLENIAALASEKSETCMHFTCHISIVPVTMSIVLVTMSKVVATTCDKNFTH